MRDRRFRPDPHLFAVSIVFAVVTLLSSGGWVSAQTSSDYDAERARAFRLFDEHKLVEALPILEKLNEQKPDDMVVLDAIIAEPYNQLPIHSSR